MQTEATEDYLRAIYEIQRVQGKVTTSILAERLGVAPASVTGMIKKLASMQLVDYEPYKGVVLTESGRSVALEVIRHHRLIELFLSESLDVPWDRVHEEAAKIEHVLSEYLEDQIDAALGHPVTDPHGAPIPNRDGKIDEPDTIPLSQLKPGHTATVCEVSDHRSDFLRYLAELGLRPHAQVRVVAAAPFGGPTTLRVGDTEHMVGEEVINNVLVTDVVNKNV